MEPINTRRESPEDFYKKIGLKPGNPKPEFESVYAHTLVEYGIDQPQSILEFFRHEDIQKAFKRSFDQKDCSILHNEAVNLIDWNKIGDELRKDNIDPSDKFAGFTLVFNEMVELTRTPAEVRDTHKLDEIITLLQEGDLHKIRAKNIETMQDIKEEDYISRLHDYLKAIITATHRIDIKGIFSRSGAGREAIYFPVEEIYTPLTTRNIRRYIKSYDKKMIKHTVGEDKVELTAILSRSKKLLIVGEPGGGKTTFLKLVASVLAKDVLGITQDGRKKYLGLSVKKAAPIPIFLRLAGLADLIKKESLNTGPGGSWKWITYAVEQSFNKADSFLIQKLLEKGDCALLLDGFDEVADQSVRNKIAEIVNSVISRFGDNMFIISSRPFGYSDISDINEINTIHIDSFGEKEIVEFLNRWGRGLSTNDYSKEMNKYISELKSAIIDYSSIRQLAKNPVMLTCLCVVHWNEKRLPEGKADLLAAVLRWLLNAREKIRNKRDITNTFAKECFKALAMAMTCHRDGKKVIVDLSWAADQLTEPFADVKGIDNKNQIQRKDRNFLEEEMLDSGIVEKYGTGQLRFWHLNFQEYYTARALVDRSDEEWWDKIKDRLDNKQWIEVLDHLAGCLAWTGRYRLDLLTENIIGTIQKDDLLSSAKIVGVLGRILKILKVYEYTPPKRLKWNDVKDSVMDIFTLEGSKIVPIEDRIKAAQALGEGSDPRIKPQNPEMLKIPGMDNILLGK